MKVYDRREEGRTIERDDKEMVLEKYITKEGETDSRTKHLFHHLPIPLHGVPFLLATITKVWKKQAKK